MSPNNLFRRYAAPPAQAQQINFSINDSIEVGDKNTFQVYIADYDILNAPMYTEGWLKKWCIAK